MYTYIYIYIYIHTQLEGTTNKSADPARRRVRGAQSTMRGIADLNSTTPTTTNNNKKKKNKKKKKNRATKSAGLSDAHGVRKRSGDRRIDIPGILRNFRSARSHGLSPLVHAAFDVAV